MVTFAYIWKTTSAKSVARNHSTFVFDFYPFIFIYKLFNLQNYYMPLHVYSMAFAVSSHICIYQNFYYFFPARLFFFLLLLLLLSFLLSLLLSSMGTCLKFHFPNLYDFYVVAVLICYSHSVIYCRVHNVFRTLWRMFFLAKFVAGSLELG